MTPIPVHRDNMLGYVQAKSGLKNPPEWVICAYLNIPYYPKVAEGPS